MSQSNFAKPAKPLFENAATPGDEFFKAYFEKTFERMVMNIEYSVLSNYHGKGIVAGNTEMHFLKGLEEGFDGFKADMRLTSDGVVILCHDEGYTFTPDGKITAFDKQHFVPIHEMPFSKIRSLEFEHPFEGHILHPCTLDTMLSLCEKHDVVAYLTLRAEPWREETAKRMIESLCAHKMQRRTIINLYTGVKEAVDCVSKLLPGLVFCNTKYPDVPLTKELIDSSSSDGYKIICLNLHQLGTVTAEMNQYAASKGIRIWTWGVANEEDCAAHIKQGITGFQMCSRDVNNSVVKEILFALNY